MNTYQNKLIQELSSINPNYKLPEIPYMLTPEEEESAISYKINSLRDLASWKMRQAQMNLNQIEERLSTMDFNKQFDREAYLKHISDLKYWDENKKRMEADRAKEEQDKKDALHKLWDANKMYNLLHYTSLEKYGKELVYNEHNSHYIKAMCMFLSLDPRFETDDEFKKLKYSFKKGILIRGNYGIGKTHIIKCLAENGLQPIKMCSMIKISEKIKDEGEYQFGHWVNKIYLDDVGTEEPTINHYGTKINFFKDFIEKAYNWHDYSKLIITTNCSFDEIEEKYGGRVRSRMAEMFNIINVTGEDFRKL